MLFNCATAWYNRVMASIHLTLAEARDWKYVGYIMCRSKPTNSWHHTQLFQGGTHEVHFIGA